MKKVLVNFGGAILLYAVIFGGIVAISYRMSYINSNIQVAVNK